MIKSIKNAIKAAGWAIVAVFSADIALAECQPIVHPVHGSELEPDPEKVIGECAVCGVSLYKGEYVFECDCGNKTCEGCQVECGHGGCLTDRCKKCMYYNAELNEWFCITTGYDDIQKGNVVSECMAEYLKVAEVVISRKE